MSAVRCVELTAVHESKTACFIHGLFERPLVGVLQTVCLRSYKKIINPMLSDQC